MKHHLYKRTGLVAGVAVLACALPSAAGAFNYAVTLPAGLLRAVAEGRRVKTTKPSINCGTLVDLPGPLPRDVERKAMIKAAEPHVMNAQAFYKARDWSAVAGESRVAMELAPGTLDGAMAAHLLGNAYMAQGRYAEAKSELKKLLPSSHFLYTTPSFNGDMALAFLKTGELGPIRALVEPDIKLYNGEWVDFDANTPGFGDPDHIAASVRLARGEFFLFNYVWPDEPMDYKAAAEELSEADRMVPGNPLISLRLGETLLELHRYVEAERYLKVAMDKGKGYLVTVAGMLHYTASCQVDMAKASAAKAKR